MEDFFLLAKTLSLKLCVIMGRIVAFTCILACSPYFALGQGCDCPPTTSCGTCVGGLTSLTLRLNGPGPITITVSDQLGTVFSDVIDSENTFTFTGSLPNQRFAGPNIELRIDGILDALIPSNCGSTTVGISYGSFTVVAGQSLNGGALCCAPALIETVPPVISNCPANITVDLPPTSCSMVVSWSLPLATDNCMIESFTSSPGRGDIFLLGDTDVEYTALDIYGNTSSCSFIVTVNDPVLPIITSCPSNIVVIANSSCEAVVSWTAPSASDNCSVILTSSHTPGSTFPFGITAVTYTATDQAGNVATCTFNITVNNPTNPAITECPGPITLTANENGEEVASWEEPQASVLCGGVTVTKSHEPGSTFMIGTTSVEYEFIDENSKSATCSFNVIVLGLEAEFTIAKVVTPDGDGINDIWMLENIENFEDNTVVVVDRWGNAIFRATGYDNETIFWDGTNESGTIVPTGTYFYTVEVRFQGAIVRRKGYLEVIQ